MRYPILVFVTIAGLFISCSTVLACECNSTTTYEYFFDVVRPHQKGSKHLRSFDMIPPTEEVQRKHTEIIVKNLQGFVLKSANPIAVAIAAIKNILFFEELPASEGEVATKETSHQGIFATLSREKLSNKNELTKLYRKYKDAGLVVTAFAQVYAADWLQGVEPVLRKKFNPDIGNPLGKSGAASWQAYECDLPLGSKLNDRWFVCASSTFEDDYKAYYGTDPTPFAAWTLGFLERRYAEGGDALVVTWQHIALDFLDALAHPQKQVNNN